MTLAAGLLASLLLSTSTAGPTGAEAELRAAVGQPVPADPAIMVADLGGRPVDLRARLAPAPAATGAATLLVFWATWCQPCVHEVPVLNEMQRYYGKRGLRVIGLGVGGEGDSPAVLADAVSRLRIEYEVLFDSESRAAKVFGVTALPWSALIEGNGVVRWMGAALPPDINARIKEIVSPVEDSGHR